MKVSHDFKEKALLILFAAAVILGVIHYNDIYGMLQTLLRSMNALIIGAILAFVLNVPMKKFEEIFDKIPYLRVAKRGLAILGVVVGFILVVTGIMMIIIPTMTVTIQEFVQYVSTNAPDWVNYLQKRGLLTEELRNQALETIRTYANFNTITTYAPSILFGLIDNLNGIFSSILTWVMAFFFTLSFLGAKEHLKSMTNQLMEAFVPKRISGIVSYVGKVISETYSQFLMRQMLEAFIMGFLTYLTYSIAQIPYAEMAGVLMGVLSFIPYIGPMSACAITALFIVTQNPLRALLAVIIYAILQLVEGNIIYPRVVGRSVGLPTLFTLAAALIGGSLFGLLGMIFFVPVFAVIYRLMREWTEYRLKQQKASNPSVPEETI
ncbi:AI-2E family transporter [Streptococcus sp. DD13]|uniref:AI-2E family transporter n=1 Tax=Streptococcus sp. DD13 TaxID=1777881 RepID=UPI000791D90C|nr:AI-2E family transporter [Streptococcus sp. DD13]KXT78208.1 putative permease [Streptococcus sp. DD13]